MRDYFGRLCKRLHCVLKGWTVVENEWLSVVELSLMSMSTLNG